MEILLVRHGETGGNVARRHQLEHTPLTPEGKQQATKVAEKIKQYQPTHIISSNLVRAIETAGIISQTCNLVPETSRHFIELDRPDHLYGYHHRSLPSLVFYALWYVGRDSGRAEHGESYRALRERIQLAQQHLAEYPNDARVVVVSHSVFIGLFVAHMCRTRSLNPAQAFRAFYRILTMPNTHITKIRFDNSDSKKICSWSVE